MISNRSHHRSASVALAAFVLLGCQTKPGSRTGTINPSVVPPGTASTAVIANTDPSAMKLHDIEGALLMYYAVNKKLPDRFEQLQPLADVDTPITLDCPGSDQPYVYTPDGIKLQERDARIVLYEPAPLHSGYRLTIVIDEPGPLKPLVAEVVAMPESFFLLHPPGSASSARSRAAPAELRPPAPPLSPADAGQAAPPPGTRP